MTDHLTIIGRSTVNTREQLGRWNRPRFLFSTRQASRPNGALSAGPRFRVPRPIAEGSTAIVGRTARSAKPDFPEWLWIFLNGCGFS